MIYAAFRAWKTLRRYFISLPSKTAFYCVTKSREPTTNESDVFSVLACTLFVSVDDKLVSILPYHRKAKACKDFLKYETVKLPSIDGSHMERRNKFLQFREKNADKAGHRGF